MLVMYYGYLSTNKYSYKSKHVLVSLSVDRIISSSVICTVVGVYIMIMVVCRKNNVLPIVLCVCICIHTYVYSTVSAISVASIRNCIPKLVHLYTLISYSMLQ